jgi:hypothetical protein
LTIRRKASNGDDRARKMLAQEAARIIVDQGIENYRLAKTKAAERLGLTTRGSLPGNPEIENAVGEHLKLFGRESHLDLLRALRQVALSAMALLAAFTPRLVGPVLHGTAAPNSAVNLHVFSDTTEQVAQALRDSSLQYRIYERRIKSRRDRSETFSGFRFMHDNWPIEATVFPVDGIRQAPISPVNGKPMQRADTSAVLELLRDN